MGVVQIKTAKLVAILDIGFLGAVIAVTLGFIHGNTRLTFVGILCAAFTIGMYASPLSVMVGFFASSSQLRCRFSLYFETPTKSV